MLLPGLCTSSSVFVDVGAHIGSVLADVRRCHPSIRAIAIEADPDKASNLARKFPDVEVHSCALGERHGEVSFFVNSERPGYSSLDQGHRSGDDLHEISVPMRRLDDILPDSADVDVVKIDVEGAELGVLRGSAALISRSRPVILFESGPGGGEAMGFTVESLFDWLAERDYEILVPNRVAHNGPALGREGFLESHYYPLRTLNYFAVPKERRIEIRDRARRTLGIVVPNVADQRTPRR
jgi:FkbM family methyltransferase